MLQVCVGCGVDGGGEFIGQLTTSVHGPIAAMPLISSPLVIKGEIGWEGS